MKRAFHSAAFGSAANALAGGAASARTRPGDRLTSWLRTTGNGTFVAFAAPLLLRRGSADREGWWFYVGAHASHLAGLAVAARRGGGFSAASRYGGALGYATVVALGATSYSPGGVPARHAVKRRLHRAGEQILFGLYAFTIVHGYRAKGRDTAVYGPLAALWAAAAARGRARWPA
jgi:hypothetical protein